MPILNTIESLKHYAPKKSARAKYELRYSSVRLCRWKLNKSIYGLIQIQVLSAVPDLGPSGLRRLGLVSPMFSSKVSLPSGSLPFCIGRPLCGPLVGLIRNMRIVWRPASISHNENYFCCRQESTWFGRCLRWSEGVWHHQGQVDHSAPCASSIRQKERSRNATNAEIVVTTRRNNEFHYNSNQIKVTWWTMVAILGYCRKTQNSIEM